MGHDPGQLLGRTMDTYMRGAYVCCDHRGLHTQCRSLLWAQGPTHTACTSAVTTGAYMRHAYIFCDHRGLHTRCVHQLWPQGPTHVVCTLAVTAGASPASALVSLGTEHTFKGNGASLNLTLRAFPPTTRAQAPSPNRAVTATEHRRGPQTSPHQSHPYQGGNDQRALRKEKNSPHFRNTGLA